MDFKTWLDLERLRSSWTSMLIFLHIGGMHNTPEVTGVDPGLASGHDSGSTHFQADSHLQGDGHSPFADFSDHGSGGSDQG